ncbi:hypothetical protein EC9_53860 [Rosistilla ulvae]|uniref:Uncharacterized protein n=1 Tax=Rosistilla ulvae TaxID=1930277 RepID=A0A517M8F3_9BACT|nr:hypothetical protein EC9_53860 [Rosistilla ulvae]
MRPLENASVGGDCGTKIPSIGETKRSFQKETVVKGNAAVHIGTIRAKRHAIGPMALKGENSRCRPLNDWGLSARHDQQMLAADLPMPLGSPGRGVTDQRVYTSRGNRDSTVVASISIWNSCPSECVSISGIRS